MIRTLEYAEIVVTDGNSRILNIEGQSSTYTTRTSIFTYRTLISRSVGVAGEDPPTYKMRAFFLMPFALSVPILNKKSHRTRVVETFKIWPKFESFHSPCPMRFFVQNWHTKSQGHKKNCPYFLRWRIRPYPSQHNWQLE